MNKVDLIDEEARADLRLRHPDAVLISAETGEGLDELRARIAAAVRETLTAVELLVPFGDGDRLSELHEIAGDLEREDREDGVRVRALLPATVAERFARYELDGHQQAE
jgi:GTP-binding protein HflX